MVFLVLGSSKAPRALGSVPVRGPPERHASAVSFADAPRFARNALRPIGQNGFDAHAPNANLGRTGDAAPVAVQSAALEPYRRKEVPVRWAHTHMKDKAGINVATTKPSRFARIRNGGLNSARIVALGKNPPQTPIR